MKVKRQKIGLPTQGKTTDYTDPKSPYSTRTQNTKKLLRIMTGYVQHTNPFRLYTVLHAWITMMLFLMVQSFKTMFYECSDH